MYGLPGTGVRKEKSAPSGIFNKNCGTANEQCATETIDDPIEHVVQINFGTQCSAEINQGLAQIVAVAIEKFIEPDLELILDRSEQQRGHDRGNHARNDAQRLETGSQEFANHNDHCGV